MSARRRRALALLVATLAPRAAGEEATLASLTGLFQREPERAAALVASAREGARAINQSRHSEGHETYFRQRRRIEVRLKATMRLILLSRLFINCAGYAPGRPARVLEFLAL